MLLYAKSHTHLSWWHPNNPAHTTAWVSQGKNTQSTQKSSLEAQSQPAQLFGALLTPFLKLPCKTPSTSTFQISKPASPTNRFSTLPLKYNIKGPQSTNASMCPLPTQKTHWKLFLAAPQVSSALLWHFTAHPVQADIWKTEHAQQSKNIHLVN